MFKQSLLLILEKRLLSLNSCSGCLSILPPSPSGHQLFFLCLCSDKVTLLFGFLVLHKATEKLFDFSGNHLTFPYMTALQKTKCQSVMKQLRGLTINDSERRWQQWTKQFSGLSVDLLIKPNHDEYLEICVQFWERGGKRPSESKVGCKQRESQFNPVPRSVQYI